MWKVITTAELIELVKAAANSEGEKSSCVEASLLLRFGCRSTHFLDYDEEKNILSDEGCDGETREITLEEFTADYPDARWAIFNDDEESDDSTT